MEEYYFLFGLALVGVIAACVQDIRKREVPNWLNFSLIGFALAYRAFYGAFNGDLNFFIYGLIGFALFFALANLLYYSRVFAGGDAKLFMGLGIVLPYQNYYDFILLGGSFIFLLFLVGSIYSLFYSVFLVLKNWKRFCREFSVKFKKFKVTIIVFAIAFLFVFLLEPIVIAFSLYITFIAVMFLYVYLKSLEKIMIVMTKPENLAEGDWLEDDVKVQGKWIKKSVHGLSLEDIKLLKKYRISALVRNGIPFTPAFLITIVIMVFFFSSGLNLMSLLASLF